MGCGAPVDTGLDLALYRVPDELVVEKPGAEVVGWVSTEVKDFVDGAVTPLEPYGVR